MIAAVSDRPLLLSSEGRSISNVDDVEIWQGLDAHGTVVFRGFPIDGDAFYDFASRFNRAFLVSPFGDRKSAGHGNELQTVTIGRGGLSLHFEYGTSPLRPDLLWFYCRKAAAVGTGGETLLADGSAIFDRLTDAAQAALCAKRIRYSNIVSTAAFDALLRQNGALDSMIPQGVAKRLERTQGFRITDENQDRVAFEFVGAPVASLGSSGKMAVCQDLFTDAYGRPSIAQSRSDFSASVTWEDGAEIEEELLNELRTAMRSLTRGIRWRSGDFAMIDNNRVLHGRNETSDPARDVVMLASFSTRWV